MSDYCISLSCAHNMYMYMYMHMYMELGITCVGKDVVHWM